MLSLVVLANKVLSDIGTKDKTVTEELQKYKIDYEIVYITTKNYNALNDIKHIVARDENKYLIVLADDTNKTSQIYVGLDNINGDSALVLDIDTNIDVITQVLQQYKDGCENVFVRKKENPVYDFFTKLGECTYSLGLKMLKRLNDLCCDSGVVLLNSVSIDTILSYPASAKTLLNTNITPDKKFGIVRTKTIHDSPTHAQQHPQQWLMSLGIVSLIFIIVSLCSLFIYPMFNGWIYNLWIFITIVIWLALGAVVCAFFSKLLFDARQGRPIPIDAEGIPYISIVDAFTHQDLIDFNTQQDTISIESQNARSIIKEQINNKGHRQSKSSKVKSNKKATTTKTTKHVKTQPKATTTKTKATISDQPPKKRGRPRKNKE